MWLDVNAIINLKKSKNISYMYDQLQNMMVQRTIT